MAERRGPLSRERGSQEREPIASCVLRLARKEDSPIISADEPRFLRERFQSDEVPGKIQHGPAWWFNDTKSGMEDQMRSLANLGILGNFIGMLTDSRSFLSYTRHDYFRRIMCNMIGSWVENGEYPNDEEALKRIVEGISYTNAKRYFGL